MHPAATVLDAAAYTFSYDLQTRFADLDPNAVDPAAFIANQIAAAKARLKRRPE